MVRFRRQRRRRRLGPSSTIIRVRGRGGYVGRINADHVANVAAASAMAPFNGVPTYVNVVPRPEGPRRRSQPPVTRSRTRGGNRRSVIRKLIEKATPAAKRIAKKIGQSVLEEAARRVSSRWTNRRTRSGPARIENGSFGRPYRSGRMLVQEPN